MVIDMHIGGFAILQDGTGKTPHFPVDMCRHILNDVAKPLQNVNMFGYINPEKITLNFTENLIALKIQSACGI